MKGLIEFISQFIPPFPQILIFSFITASIILASGILCGTLKRRAHWRTGYTRKLLHFIIFYTAVGLHIWGGMPAVSVLGVGMGIFVILSALAGNGNFFFEAMAREEDHPRRGYFVIVPYITTALGGLLSNILFGSSAVMGYVLCGSGDAIAEPVGLKFGKHRYKILSLRKVEVAERSIEGSLSVFVVSVVLSFLFLYFLYHLPLWKAFASSLLLSIAIVFVEAISFHGADNLTLQLTASALTYIFMKHWS